MSSVMNYAYLNAIKQDCEDYTDNVIRKLRLLSLESHKPIVIVMSGASGSGKSTLATKLQQEFGAACVSADDYFVDEEGKYNYEQKNIHKAHVQCQKLARQRLAEGEEFLIVHNTSTTMKEVNTYQTIATEAGALMVVVSFELPPEMSTLQALLILADRNEHNVPFSKCEDMLKRHAHKAFDAQYEHVIHVQTQFTHEELRWSRETCDSLPNPTCTVHSESCCAYGTAHSPHTGLLKLEIDPVQAQRLGRKTCRRTKHDSLRLPPYVGLTMGFNMDNAAEIAKLFGETQVKITGNAIFAHTNRFNEKVAAIIVSAIGISRSAPREAIEFLEKLVRKPLHVTTGVDNRPPYDAKAVHDSLDFPLPTLEFLD